MIFKIQGISKGTVIKAETEILSPGQVVTHKHKQLQMENVGFNLKEEPLKDIQGEFASRNAKQDLPHESESIQAQVIEIRSIKQIQNKSKLKTTGEQTKNLNRIRNNQNWRQSNVIMVPTKPMAVEKFLECLRLGRFDVRDMRAVLRVGVIKDILKISRDEKVTKATKNRRNNEL
ncbi:MAG: hypothetical protein EZS28_034590, partial [Streblomastix strix]